MFPYLFGETRKRTNPYKTSLVSYWKLDEVSTGAGAVTRNDSYSTNHLTDNNTVASATGKIGNAGSFVRANSEYLSRVSNATLQAGDIDFTFQAWVQLASKPVGRMAIVNKESGGAVREYSLNWDSGIDRFKFMYGNGGGSVVVVNADNLGAPALATWYHIICWHNNVANTINISVNNGTVNSASMGATVPGVSAAPFEIGRSVAFGADYWNGLIDEVALWKRLLTDTERTALYNGGNGQSVL